MKFGIIGSGGREHAICYSLKKNPNNQVFCFPGNAGTESISTNVNIDINNFQILKDYIKEKKIDIVIIGPEKPLVDGLADYLEENNIKVFGPNKIASQLEGSKIFTKKICEEYNIPTAKFGIFKSVEESKLFIKNSSLPIVIKADGLASGKGVYISETIEDAFKAVDEIFGGKFGVSNNILIEEFLDGEEMSFFIISDGNNIAEFETAQDHKRVLEGDRGKNTGGMGAYCPSRLITPVLREKIINKIINPTLKALKNLNTQYKGFLYAGLMIKNDEPFLIEYNVRMGDPECQTILPKLKTDFSKIIDACCKKNLDKINIEWETKKSMCIVVCSKGYPDEFKKNIAIKNLDKLAVDQSNIIFHAGTIKKNTDIFSNGGRVLNFINLSEDFLEARKKIIKNIKTLNWQEGFFRSDIGHRVIKE